MHDGEPKTLADAIRSHIDCQQAGERLTMRVVENERRQAEFYRMIKRALSRPEMGQVAVMDESTRRVYVMGANGLVCDFALRSAEDVVLDAADGREDVVSVGEAS